MTTKFIAPETLRAYVAKTPFTGKLTITVTDGTREEVSRLYPKGRAGNKECYADLEVVKTAFARGDMKPWDGLVTEDLAFRG